MGYHGVLLYNELKEFRVVLLDRNHHKVHVRALILRVIEKTFVSTENILHFNLKLVVEVPLKMCFDPSHPIWFDNRG